MRIQYVPDLFPFSSSQSLKERLYYYKLSRYARVTEVHMFDSQLHGSNLGAKKFEKCYQISIIKSDCLGEHHRYAHY